MNVKHALLVGFSVSFVLTVALLPDEADAGERVVCALALPTDGGATSTATWTYDAGCSLLPDGGIDACSLAASCTWGNARSLALQCDNPVYYSETPSGTVTSLGQKNVRAATSSDMLIDFDVNPDPYRIDLRSGSQHISVLSVSTSANTCRVGTVQRHDP